MNIYWTNLNIPICYSTTCLNHDWLFFLIYLNFNVRQQVILKNNMPNALLTHSLCVQNTQNVIFNYSIFEKILDYAQSWQKKQSRIRVSIFSKIIAFCECVPDNCYNNYYFNFLFGCLIVLYQLTVTPSAYITLEQEISN